MRVAAGSDWVIDMGPGAGDAGGRIVAAGRPAAVAPLVREPDGALPRAVDGLSGCPARAVRTVVYP